MSDSPETIDKHCGLYTLGGTCGECKVIVVLPPRGWEDGYGSNGLDSPNTYELEAALQSGWIVVDRTTMPMPIRVKNQEVGRDGYTQDVSRVVVCDVPMFVLAMPIDDRLGQLRRERDKLAGRIRELEEQSVKSGEAKKAADKELDGIKRRFSYLEDTLKDAQERVKRASLDMKGSSDALREFQARLDALTAHYGEAEVKRVLKDKGIG
jgi:hypothetical protein